MKMVRVRFSENSRFTKRAQRLIKRLAGKRSVSNPFAVAVAVLGRKAFRKKLKKVSHVRKKKRRRVSRKVLRALVRARKVLKKKRRKRKRKKR